MSQRKKAHGTITVNPPPLVAHPRVVAPAKSTTRGELIKVTAVVVGILLVFATALFLGCKAGAYAARANIQLNPRF